MWYVGKRRLHYGNIGKNITDRDRQAMYNFHCQGIFLETIAENYECSVAYVEEVINTRPWLHPKPKEDEFVNMTWMESDHSDPLELVKIFFPNENTIPEILVKEKRQKMTWEEYLNTVDWQEAYECYGDSVSDVIIEGWEKINAQSAKLTFG